MKTFLTLGLIALVMISCKKENNVTYPESILAGQKSGNGIIYTDVIPDDSIAGINSGDIEDRLLDLDGDGVNDVKLHSEHLSSYGSGYGGSWATPLGNNEIAIPVSPSIYVDTLSLNDAIGSNLNWGTGTCELYHFSYDMMTSSHDESGLWKFGVSKYIGIKIYVDQHILYGWIREEISNLGSQNLMEYAVTKGY
jgi:hypothetical protein